MKNRGMFLETIINKTIAFYKENDIAIIHKKHLPITFHKVYSGQKRPVIDKGFITSKSEVDYYGVYNGRFIAFEAKSCNGKYLSFSNIKDHQKEYLLNIEKHKGLSFYIILFKDYNKFFIMKPNFMDGIKLKGLNLETAEKIGKMVPLNYPGIIDFIEYL